MSRGIRQGDPASGYLFNLAVEPLANHIRQSEAIGGIKLYNEVEVRLSQYADDLILFLDKRPQSITRAISEISTYSSLSGLKLNVEKTKCLSIGLHSNANPVDSNEVQYVNELKILGIVFKNNNETIFTTNLKLKLPQIKNQILHWKRRHLTMLGKITVIKSLLTSQLVHLFLSLPIHSKKDIAEIETKLFRFLWSDKNDSVKRAKIVQGPEKDGLRMLEITSFVKSLKVSWIKRLYESQQDWALMIQREIPPIQEMLTYGKSALSKVNNKVKNPFWKEVFAAWREFCDVMVPDTSQILTEKLWLNNISRFKTGIVKEWDQKGVRFVADLINNLTGAIYTKEELQNVYGIRMTFLCYSSLLRSLPKVVTQTNFKSLITYPLLPYKLSLLHKKQKVSRIAYDAFVAHLRKKYEKSQEKLEGKWMRDINFFQEGSMQNVKTATKNTYVQTFHFRLISRIISTNTFLHIIGKAEDDLCTFCHSQTETLHHLFWGCVETQTFIAKITNTLSTHFEFECQIEEKLWFFPNKDECSELQIILNLIAKITLYSSKQHTQKPSVKQFLNNLKMEAEKEFHSARLENKLDKYKEKWKGLQALPELDITELS